MTDNKWNTYIQDPDGNAWAIMGATTKAMRRAGATSEDCEAYRTKAMSGDYDNLLRATMEMVEIRISEEDEDEEMCDECGDTLLWCMCP